MTPMLADISNNWILGCTIVGTLTSVGALLVAVVAINKKQEVKVDQPLDVQLVENFVGKSEFDSHEKENRREFEALRNDLREDRRNNEVHASQRSKTIFDEIKSVRMELSAKIDSMPSRIIADLRNSKGLLDD